jgi:hypothetical protein
VCVVALDALSEFVITASDGLWDYYSPESSVLSDTRRALRRLEEDPQLVGGWLGGCLVVWWLHVWLR